jgi:hypothetical protein
MQNTEGKSGVKRPDSCSGKIMGKLGINSYCLSQLGITNEKGISHTITMYIAVLDLRCYNVNAMHRR